MKGVLTSGQKGGYLLVRGYFPLREALGRSRDSHAWRWRAAQRSVVMVQTVPESWQSGQPTQPGHDVFGVSVRLLTDLTGDDIFTSANDLSDSRGRMPDTSLSDPEQVLKG